MQVPPITRRGLMLLGIKLGVVGVLGWRMRQLQIEQNEHFRLLAEENRINMRLIWDEAKRQANLAKHGLDFSAAGEVLDSRYRLDIPVRRAGERA